MKKTLADYHRVKKSWGQEIWICNNDLYCGKILIVDAGHEGSIHRHPIKHETMLCERGDLDIEIFGSGDVPGRPEIINMKPMDSYEIPPGTWHRLSAGEIEAVVYEFSTTHSDEDVERYKETTNDFA